MAEQKAPEEPQSANAPGQCCILDFEVVRAEIPEGKLKGDKSVFIRVQAKMKIGKDEVKQTYDTATRTDETNPQWDEAGAFVFFGEHKNIKNIKFKVFINDKDICEKEIKKGTEVFDGSEPMEMKGIKLFVKFQGRTLNHLQLEKEYTEAMAESERKDAAQRTETEQQVAVVREKLQAEKDKVSRLQAEIQSTRSRNRSLEHQNAEYRARVNEATKAATTARRKLESEEKKARKAREALEAIQQRMQSDDEQGQY